MNPRVLVILTSDPETTGRTAEGVRIAAGVGTWKKADVTLCLRGAAAQAVGEWVDHLVDEDNFTRYLPIVGEFGRPVYVEPGALARWDIDPPSVPCEELDETGLARLAAASDYVLRL